MLEDVKLYSEAAALAYCLLNNCDIIQGHLAYDNLCPGHSADTIDLTLAVCHSKPSLPN